MAWNVSNGGFNIGLGSSRLSINTRDGSVGVKVSDHLSLNTKTGGLDFTL